MTCSKSQLESSFTAVVLLLIYWNYVVPQKPELKKGRGNNSRGSSKSCRSLVAGRGSIVHGHRGRAGKFLALVATVVPTRPTIGSRRDVDIGAVVVAHAADGPGASLVQALLAVVRIAIALGGLDGVTGIRLDGVAHVGLDGISLFRFDGLGGRGIRGTRQVGLAVGTGIPGNVKVLIRRRALAMVLEHASSVAGGKVTVEIRVSRSQIKVATDQIVGTLSGGLGIAIVCARGELALR